VKQPLTIGRCLCLSLLYKGGANTTGILRGVDGFIFFNKEGGNNRYPVGCQFYFPPFSKGGEGGFSKGIKQPEFI
jgi:hypothetical protein